MIVENTKTVIGLDGANSKECLRIDGKLCVVKEPIQNKTYDTEAEVMVYRIANYLGVRCCEAGMVNNRRSYSVIDRSVRNNLVSADDLLDIRSGNLTDVVRAMEKMCLSKSCIKDYLKIVLFDSITRQLDRNLTNFSFVKLSEDAKSIYLYPLYDNGLSLFSTSKVNDNLDFRSITGNSNTVVLNELIKFFNLYGMTFRDTFTNNLTRDVLVKLLTDMPEVFCNGNKKEDVINWVIDKFVNVKNLFSNKMMKSNSF